MSVATVLLWSEQVRVHSGRARRVDRSGGAENAFCRATLYYSRSFCQDRLGTNIGNVRKKRRFLQENPAIATVELDSIFIHTASVEDKGTAEAYILCAPT